MLNKPSQSQFLNIRGLRYHVRTWGESPAPAIFMVHGWMDVGASFQFLVDALQREYFVIAPDLRGYGRSEWQKNGYWFPDYVADIDALLTIFSPDQPVRLVGHSLGGNIVGQYAGVRPHRVMKMVSMEGFGLALEAAGRAPDKYVKWLDALLAPPRFKTYTDFGEVADRLQASNARLTRDKAEFLARHVAEELPEGGARLSSDPQHKLPFPTVYRMEEASAIWRRATMPILWIGATDSPIGKFVGAASPGEVRSAILERMSALSQARLEMVSDAGHMMHHDQPEKVATLVEAFFA